MGGFVCARLVLHFHWLHHIYMGNHEAVLGQALIQTWLCVRVFVWVGVCGGGWGCVWVGGWVGVWACGVWVSGAISVGSEIGKKRGKPKEKLASRIVPGAASCTLADWWIRFYGAAVGSLGTSRIPMMLFLLLQGYPGRGLVCLVKNFVPRLGVLESRTFRATSSGASCPCFSGCFSRRIKRRSTCQ